MAITRFYKNFNLSYATPTQAVSGATRQISYGTATSFDGCIKQINATERSMAGALGIQIDYKLWYDPNVTIPDDAKINNGTESYRIVTLPSKSKNKFDIGQSKVVNHKRDFLQVLSKENL